MITKHSPDKYALLPERLLDTFPTPVMDNIDDVMNDAKQLFLKREGGRITGYAIVFGDAIGPVVRLMYPPNDEELLDAAFAEFEKVHLDYGDDEGAQSYLERRTLNEVAKKRGVPEGLLTKYAGSLRRKRRTVRMRRKRVHRKTRKVGV